MASRRQRKQKRKTGGNKPLNRLNARKKDFLSIIERMGFTGDINSLPRRWGGFNCPGSLSK